MKTLTISLCILFLMSTLQGQQSYAEKLGFPSGKKVLILHVDDFGMSYDSNLGTIDAIDNGAANSASMMMPCPWVPHAVKYVKSHPNHDVGLHLTLTSEWDNYRWGPLMGKPAVPGLVDEEGALWASVNEVVKHAQAEEVYQEIKAQLDRARSMGFEPTHFDSHMGTLFATPEYLGKYVQLGLETGIPIMFPGGSCSMLKQQYRDEGATEAYIKERFSQIQALGQQVWEGGLPVLDDLHNTSYGWKLTEGTPVSDKALADMKVKKYISTIDKLEPGLTMVIMHCSDPTEVFEHFTSSGDTRKGDLLAMVDPRLKEYIEQEGIILTTWRELKERRTKVHE